MLQLFAEVSIIKNVNHARLARARSTTKRLTAKRRVTNHLQAVEAAIHLARRALTTIKQTHHQEAAVQAVVFQVQENK